MKAILTVMGKDCTGIIAAVSKALTDVNANILDISQTTMQGIFTMITVVDISACTVEFSELVRLMKDVEAEIGMQITIQHEDIFNSMHRI